MSRFAYAQRAASRVLAKSAHLAPAFSQVSRRSLARPFPDKSACAGPCLGSLLGAGLRAAPHPCARPRSGPSALRITAQRFCSVLLIQLQHRHKRLRRHLHAAQAAHLFLAAPQRFPFAGIPIFFACSGGVNPPSAKVLPSAKRLHALTRAPPPGAPEGAKKLRPQFSSSSFSTAINASVGICTLPRLRIFFLPSFCFSSSFFFRVISPP